MTVNNTNCLNPFVRKIKFLFSYHYHFFFMKRINLNHIAPLVWFLCVCLFFAISKLGAILFQY